MKQLVLLVRMWVRFCDCYITGGVFTSTDRVRYLQQFLHFKLGVAQVIQGQQHCKESFGPAGHSGL